MPIRPHSLAARLGRLRRSRFAPLGAALALAVAVGGVGAALDLRPHSGSPRVAAHAASTANSSALPSVTMAAPTPLPSAAPTPSPTPVPAPPAPTPVPTPIPAPAPVVGGRLGPAMAWDGNTGTVLLFGGEDWNDHAYADTWSWNGVRWTVLHPATSPPARSGSVMGWDPAHHQVVLFGGADTSGHGVMYHDTWTWDGHTWTERHPATTPAIWLLQGSTEGFMEYDPAHAQLVMVGATEYGNDTTWTWDGADWTVHTGRQRVRGTPPAWDPVTRRLTLILQGGQGEPAGIQYTWNGSDWDAAPLADPSIVPAPVLATDGGRGLVAVDLHGGTWRWDGTAWHRDSAAGQAPMRNNPGIAADPVHGTVLVYGGTQEAGQATAALSTTSVWDGSRWRTL